MNFLPFLFLVGGYNRSGNCSNRSQQSNGCSEDCNCGNNTLNENECNCEVNNSNNIIIDPNLGNVSSGYDSVRYEDRPAEPPSESYADQGMNVRMDSRMNVRTDPRIHSRMEARPNPGMNARMDPRINPRMDARAYQPQQGGTCGCEDNRG